MTKFHCTREEIDSSGLFFIFELCPLAKRVKRIRRSPFFLFLQAVSPEVFAFLLNLPTSLLLCAGHSLLSVISNAVVAVLPTDIKCLRICITFISFASFFPGRSKVEIRLENKSALCAVALQYLR